MAIDFRSNFVHWLSYENFNFEIKKEGMLVKEHRGIENALFGIIKNRIIG